MSFRFVLTTIGKLLYLQDLFLPRWVPANREKKKEKRGEFCNVETPNPKKIVNAPHHFMLKERDDESLISIILLQMRTRQLMWITAGREEMTRV